MSNLGYYIKYRGDTITYPDGTTYKGGWDDHNRYHGKGVYKYNKTGMYYEGVWYHGVHIEGKTFNSDGSEYTEKWIDKNVNWNDEYDEKIAQKYKSDRGVTL